ncbi:eukaryotic translation initiation factor 3 subunit 8 N-terminus-domain-containing protein [Aspergillus karnatakaensis]|uniref:translation initiation factor eIF3 core subunit c n=1 Tax=Aspergillus karnatakaensis TaxID=1810916 RepID=UPI003CCD5BE8
MSRFFYGNDSDSESSGSDEEELYSDEEAEKSEEESSEDDEDAESSEEESSEDEDAGKSGANRFIRDVSESEESEDEEVVKIVKSAKNKRLEELEATIKAIDNAQKINDWAVISTEFDKLNRQIVKVVQSGPVPRIYVKTVADLEDFVNETVSKQKSSNKKMNASNAKGFNAIKQKIKKNNKDYSTQVEKYRADKDGYLEGEEEEEKKKPAATAPRVTKLDRVEAPAAVGDDDGFATVGRGGKTLQYTPESILKHLRVIVESRGKKNTDRLEQIKTMEKLLEVAQNPYQRIRVYLTLISTRFDLTTTSTAAYMSVDQWKAAEQELATLLSVLETNRDYVVSEGAEEWEDDEKQPQVTPGQTLYIPGSIVSYVERLDDELTRSLQHIDPHTAEYIERLSDEKQLYTNLVRTQIYIEALTSKEKTDSRQDSLNRVVMRRLEHIYFKPSQVVTILEDSTDKALPAELKSSVTSRGSIDAQDLVHTLCNYLFKNSDGILRARAMLSQIYFLALHDQYYRARDLMLMSHLSENIANFDVSSQILFNRTLVQIGLCAFRAGLIYEAQNTLSEICGSGRQKELLAQGIILQRYSTVSPEQERLERQRQLPFHMHINLELLECIYLTSSMFLEVPLMAQTSSSPEMKRRVISKTFRRMLDYNERQVFTGPAENTRDGVIMSAKFLAAGDWKKAAEMLNSIKIWELMPQPEKIKELLSQQVQEEGLRTYLFTYAPFYDSLSISTLSTMFELPEKKIAAIISRMISHEELAAALDQVNDAIVFRKGVELSRLQSQIVTLADKSMNLLEANEKTLEQRTQGMANAFQRDQGAGGRGGRGGGRGGRGGGPRFPGGGQRRPGGQQFGGGALGGAIKA